MAASTSADRRRSVSKSRTGLWGKIGECLSTMVTETPSRMLKNSPFPPAQPRRAGTLLFPCGVLASFRSSTETRPPHHSAARTNVVLLIRRTVRPRGYASGFALPAALLDDLFDQPVGRPVNSD